MSAYVVEDKTINRIVAGLFYSKDRNNHKEDPLLPKPTKELQEALADEAEFGKTLYSMNVNAVEQRYPDCVKNPDNLPGQVSDDGKHIPYSYKKEIAPQSAQLLKSLQCYLYQCSEGDVPTTPLFGLLKQYAQQLAYTIACETKEYKAAEWG